MKKKCIIIFSALIIPLVIVAGCIENPASNTPSGKSMPSSVTSGTQSNILTTSPLPSPTEKISHLDVGLLEISTDPSEAEIYIDGAYAGLSPVSKELPPGNYVVTIHKEGKKDKSLNVNIQAGQKTTYFPAKWSGTPPKGIKPDWPLFSIQGAAY